jgi:predicted TPR repeat methyltransferase
MFQMCAIAARKAWFAPAASDFRRAAEKDARHDLAWDRLGMTHETTGELDQAISDYSQELALSPLGRTRLAGCSCDPYNIAG